MDILRTRTLPFLARRNYYFEMWHLLAWGLVAATVESNVAALVVAKTFHGSHWMVSVASASPYFAHLVSLVWGMVCVGRPKLRLVAAFGWLVTLMVSSIGLIPHSDRYGWLYVTCMGTAQIFISGMITARTALWKANYPQHVRAAITARLQTMRFLSGVAASLVIAWLFDRDPSIYRVVFPIVGLCGVAAIYLLRFIHVRHEKAQLRRAVEPLDGDLGEGIADPFSLVALLSPRHVFGHMVRVLRDDNRFYRYCAALMLTGSGNLMMIGVMVVIVHEELNMTYWAGIVLLFALDKLVLVGSLPRWGRYFDRVGVVRFRVINGICWSSSIAFGLLGSLVLGEFSQLLPWTYLLAVVFFFLNRIATGAANAGGALAWHIGHLHFARPEEAEIYMGVHVFLAGLRGLIMPFLGIWLWNHVHWWVWAVALALSLGGLLSYEDMARHERSQSLHNADHASTSGHAG